MAHDEQNVARYAIIFAADAGPEALYEADRDTSGVFDLALKVGQEAERRRLLLAVQGGVNFYPQAFVEVAAQALRTNPHASFEELCQAGQDESDSLGGGS